MWSLDLVMVVAMLWDEVATKRTGMYCIIRIKDLLTECLFH